MQFTNRIDNVKYLSDNGFINIYELEDNFLPPIIDQSLITSVFVFVIKNSKILVIKNKKKNRDIEIPGGHIEMNESPITAVMRETYEEAYVNIKNIQPIVLYEINDQLAIKYPKKSYQCFFIAEVDSIDEFIENEEISERFFMDKPSFVSLPWSKEYPDLINILVRNWL